MTVIKYTLSISSAYNYLILRQYCFKITMNFLLVSGKELAALSRPWLESKGRSHGHHAIIWVPHRSRQILADVPRSMAAYSNTSPQPRVFILQKPSDAPQLRIIEDLLLDNYMVWYIRDIHLPNCPKHCFISYHKRPKI